MNQFTTIPTLFDHLIAKKELEQLLKTYGYEAVARKFSVRVLIDFLLAAGPSRNGKAAGMVPTTWLLSIFLL